MKETFYFSHDYNARSDPRIIKLLMKYGMEGYGIYWSVIETLYDQNGYALRSHYDCIAYELRVEYERIKEIIEGSGLFKIEGDKFYSESVLRRLETRNIKSEKTRDSANKRWERENANALRTQSEGNAIKESKVKESKEEKKEKEKKEASDLNPNPNPNPEERDKKIIPIPIDPERQKWIDLAKEYNQEQIEKYPDEPFRRKQWTWEMAKEYKEDSNRQDIETQKWFDAEEAREREEKEAARDRDIPTLPDFEEWDAKAKSKRKYKNTDDVEIL